MNTNALGDLIILLWLLIGFVLILWVLLPFAVFGIKAKLDRLIELQAATLKQLGGTPPPPKLAPPASTKR